MGLVVRKLACDANIHRVITDGRSSILDYGRSTRTIPPAVYTSLVLRDFGCRFEPDGAVEVLQPDGTLRTSDPPLLC